MKLIEDVENLNQALMRESLLKGALLKANERIQALSTTLAELLEGRNDEQ